MRQIAASLRESLQVHDKDALVDILTYVLSEYVVEGPPPLAAHEVERLEDLAGLSLARLIGALQTRLDTPGLELFRVEGDEVKVQTGQGWVTLMGRPGASATASPAAAVEQRPPPVAPGATAPIPDGSPGAAGVHFDEGPMPPRGGAGGRSTADEARLRGRGDLVGESRGVVTPPPPRPRGLSVNGRPTRVGAQPGSGAGGGPGAPGAGAGAAPASRAAAGQGGAGQPPAAGQSPGAGAEGAPPQAPADPAAPASPSGGKDDASIRFSLLELD